MSFNLAYSGLTPTTNGKSGPQLTLQDPRIIDNAIAALGAGLPSATMFGIDMTGNCGFYFSAAALIVCFFLTLLNACIGRRRSLPTRPCSTTS